MTDAINRTHKRERPQRIAALFQEFAYEDMASEEPAYFIRIGRFTSGSCMDGNLTLKLNGGKSSSYRQRQI